MLGVGSEHGERGGIEIDDVGTLGLGGGKHPAVGSFDPAAAERHPAGIEVHVVPAQAEQLGPSSTCARGYHQEHMQLWVSCRHMVEQGPELVGGWRVQLASGGHDAVGTVGGVVPHPPQRIA
jgi:hypothetical protein